jgi:esterase/lipase superfamily enzyme
MFWNGWNEKRLSQLTDTVVRGPTAPKPSFVELRFNYATDRLADPEQVKLLNKDPTKYFLGRLDPDFKDFSFGTVSVTIPTQRKPGELNLPSSWSFTRQPDPDRFFMIQAIDAMSREAFMKLMNVPGNDSESSLLLFVHGFDVTFADAALRTAQLAHDLQFPGKVMFYSWPSAGNVADYWMDEDSSRISTPRFRKLLTDLLATKITHIYIVAHSMGTRIVIPTVDTLASLGTDVSKISELLLAAPDFNEIEFKELASGFSRLRAKGTHVTIYASSTDFALRASHVVHSYRRLGESAPRLETFVGLDSVDASAAAPMRRAYGHSYVCDSAQVIGDMEDIVLNRLPPKDRGLVAIPDTSQSGWKFPK